MKKYTWSCGLVVFMLSVSTTKASEFEGLYIGADSGYNSSTLTSKPKKSSNYAGAVGGYNWDMQGYLFGVEGFYDGHTSSYTGRDGGMDLKLGFPRFGLMPYAKLGVAATVPGSRLHVGGGLEYKLADSWSVNGEWMTDSKKVGTETYKNNNFVVGLNYYFDGGKKAAAREAAAREETQREVAREVAKEVAKREAAAREIAAKEAAEKEAAASDAATKGTAEKEAAAREALAKEAAAKEAAAKEAAAKVAAAKEAAAARDAAAKETLKASIIEKSVRLEGANFVSGSSKLLPGASSILDEVVSAAKQFPDIELDVTGHSDNAGKAKKNLKLSQGRADAVKAYLVKKGVAANRISSEGLGSDMPVADNATAEGRAKNRRVEIRYSIKEEKKVHLAE